MCTSCFLFLRKEWLDCSSCVIKASCIMAQVTLNIPEIVSKPGLGGVLVFTRNARRLSRASTVSWDVALIQPLLLSPLPHMFCWVPVECQFEGVRCWNILESSNTKSVLFPLNPPLSFCVWLMVYMRNRCVLDVKDTEPAVACRLLRTPTNTCCVAIESPNKLSVPWLDKSEVLMRPFEDLSLQCYKIVSV